MQASAKTAIELTGFDAVNKTINLNFISNGKIVKTVKLSAGSIIKQNVYQINDYRLKVNQFGNIATLEVFNVNAEKVASSIFDFAKPQEQQIFNEQ